MYPIKQILTFVDSKSYVWEKLKISPAKAHASVKGERSTRGGPLGVLMDRAEQAFNKRLPIIKMSPLETAVPQRNDHILSSS